MNINNIKSNYPKNCPSCNTETVIDGKHLICPNPDCSGKKLDRIVYYCEKLGLEDIGKETLTLLFNKKLLPDISYLYTLDLNIIKALEGMGDKKIQNYVNTLKEKSNTTLGIFLVSLGIDGLGETNIEKLLINYQTWDDIKLLSENQLKDIFTDQTALKIYTGIEENIDLIDKLLTNNHIILSSVDKDNEIAGKAFCITGATTKMVRNDYEKEIKKQGGFFKSSVSKKVNYLVTNTPNSGTGKNKKAKEYGTEIITEDVLWNMLESGFEKAKMKKDNGNLY